MKLQEIHIQCVSLPHTKYYTPESDALHGSLFITTHKFLLEMYINNSIEE